MDYPEQRTRVTVSIDTIGSMVESIPDYPEGGWEVIAEQSGLIDGEFNYLFYETEFFSSQLNIPEEGFIVRYEKRGDFFDWVLPRLGIEGKEATEFKDWWLGRLKKSRYYDIRLLPRKEIDRIEEMKIKPEPDSVIRVRFIFMQLEEFTELSAPEFELVPERKGFTVVEWGGLLPG